MKFQWRKSGRWIVSPDAFNSLPGSDLNADPQLGSALRCSPLHVSLLA